MDFNNLIDYIKNNLSLVDIMANETGTSVRKAGSLHEITCPFHGGKDSLRIYPDGFKCFNTSCGVAGDIFDFIMEYRNISFKESIKYLVENYNVPIDNKDIKKQLKITKKQKHKKLAYNLAKKFYRYNLIKTAEGKKAQEYLYKRGIKPKTIKKFELGYAPRGKKLKKFLNKKGAEENFLHEIGLINSKYSDFFQNRIMFSDPFYGRSISDNSNFKHLYMSGQHEGLYNYKNAKKHEKVILTEGHMDLLSVYQALEELGFDNHFGVLSSFGTNGFKEKFLKRIQYSKIKKFIILYDNDDAGRKSATKTGYMLEDAGYDVRVAELPYNMDANEYLQFPDNSPNDFWKLISQSINPLEFEIKNIIDNHRLKTFTDKLECINHIEQEFAGREFSALKIPFIIEYIAEKLKMDDVSEIRNAIRAIA